MQLTSLFVTLAAAVSMVAAYPITGNDVNCRSGPGTSYKAVKSYKKGADVKISCQTHGESINGNTLWDKTQDGCYVADYYVKTGTNSMVAKECGGSGGGSKGKSKYNGAISRKEILERANYWVNKHVPYSMSKTYPDQQGRKYRTDCSGFVSMALHATSPGYSTVTLGSIGKAISWSQLKPGDFVGTIGAGTGGAAGHVVIFTSWANSGHTKYNTLECRGTYGCVKHARYTSEKINGVSYKPFRYIRVTD